jgi:hypothetical protein
MMRCRISTTIADFIASATTSQPRPVSEESLCSGKEKDFDVIRPCFDNLFLQNVIHLIDGFQMDTGAFILVNKYLLKQCAIATLEDVYFVDDTHVEYTMHWCIGRTSIVTHVTAFVVDGKITMVKPCKETMGASAHLFSVCCQDYRCKRLSKSISFEGWSSKRKVAHIE